jgi:hypothetical protein
MSIHENLSPQARAFIGITPVKLEFQREFSDKKIAELYNKGREITYINRKTGIPKVKVKEILNRLDDESIIELRIQNGSHSRKVKLFAVQLMNSNSEKEDILALLKEREGVVVKWSNVLEWARAVKRGDL